MPDQRFSALRHLSFVRDMSSRAVRAVALGTGVGCAVLGAARLLGDADKLANDPKVREAYLGG